MKAAYQAKSTRPAKGVRHAGPDAPSRSHLAAPVAEAAPVIQRKCACGGGCPSCQEKLQAQPKLAVSSPGDRYERQADRVADQVMRMPEQAGFLPERRGEETALIERTPARRSAGSEAGLDATELRGLNGRGRALPAPSRTFFEQRFGHDFSGVRVHTDAHANALARSVDALAFTHANHVVFGAGEYSPETAAGRRLLAHELTHTIQQGAASGQVAPPVQRSVVSDQPAPSPSPEGETPIFGPAPQPPEPTAAPAARPCPSHGDLGQVPNDLACPTATDTRSAGTSVLFGVNSTALDPAGLATVRAVAGAWHTGGGAGVLRIDGYASVEGGQRLNWRLACARAMAVAAELEAPTDGSAGVPSANIEFFAHGETTDFSCTNLPPNRRAVITTTGGAPAPGPPCPLTISGPDEVDHYCAAYVPSDAASCGTFPAPNITLTAAGAAAGATLNWTVVAGNAAIVGAATGGSVDIQGTAASATADDVTVQVTDGSCTVAHRLTVREPSSLTSAQAPGTSGGMIQNIVTYTVQDQFGNAMGANICVDETLTLCADNSGRGLPSMGDAGTDASGQVTDTLSFFPTPANRCTLINQSITAGGCGPLLNNTITVQPAGVTLTPGASCASGDPCP